MNVLAIADLHWELFRKEVELIQSANGTCQLCVLLGDIPLDQLKLISRCVSLPTVGVLGNHDERGLLGRAGFRDIHGESVQAAGVRIAGIGGSPRYKEDPDRPMFSQEESLATEKRLERQLPADILICHSSPYDRRADAPHRGFRSVSRYIRRVRPACVLHGHDHDDSVSDRRYLLPVNGRRAVRHEMEDDERREVHDTRPL